jgi:hypothetical protein
MENRRKSPSAEVALDRQRSCSFRDGNYLAYGVDLAISTKESAARLIPIKGCRLLIQIKGRGARRGVRFDQIAHAKLSNRHA